MSLPIKRQRGEDGYAAPGNAFPCLRLRGLPFGASKEDIQSFLEVTPIDILILERGGRPSGQALVLLAPDDMSRAMAKDKQNMGSRYIEVFEAPKTEYYRAIVDEMTDGRGPRDEGAGGYGGRGPRPSVRSFSPDRRPPPMRPIVPVGPNPRGVASIIRLRGLPFEVSPVDVTAWIARFNLRLLHPIVPEDVVVATKDGQSIGIAFVELKNLQDAERLLELNRKYFGTRYVEVDISSLEEQIRYIGDA